MHPDESNVYERLQFGIITEVKFLLDDSGNMTDVFSGFVAVRLLTSCESFGWVKWSYPAMGQSGGHGIVVCPMENDVVAVEFDPRGFPVVVGSMLFSQAAKAVFNQQDYGVLSGSGKKEADDVRLKIKKGEVMVRGNNGSSVHFRNDGTTILKLDDTKEDAQTTVFGMDVNKNVFILNAQNVNVMGTETTRVECKNAEIEVSEKASVKATDAEIEASNAKVISDNIELGKTGTKSAVIRALDRCEHIDPVTGLSVVSTRYLTESKSVEAS